MSRLSDSLEIIPVSLRSNYKIFTYKYKYNIPFKLRSPIDNYGITKNLEILHGITLDYAKLYSYHDEK